MAIQKIRMRPEGSNNYADILYPETSADMVLTSSGKTVEADITDLKECSKYRLTKDANGIYKEIQYKRKNGTLVMKSVLSGGTSPKYTTRTETWYAINGTTVLKTNTYTITYDADGDFVNEVMA